MSIQHVLQLLERAHSLVKQRDEFRIYTMKEATLTMICKSLGVKRPIVDLCLHDGNDFLDVRSKLVKTLRAKDSTGIRFLHGPSETGKTYDLRYLINEIKSKPMIDVPSDFVHVRISSKMSKSESFIFVFLLYP